MFLAVKMILKKIKNHNNEKLGQWKWREKNRRMRGEWEVCTGSVKKLSVLIILHNANHGCGEMSSPGLHLFNSPRHLVYFLLQASDGFTLLFGAGICTLRRMSRVSQLESISQCMFVNMHFFSVQFGFRASTKTIHQHVKYYLKCSSVMSSKT